VKVIGCNGGAVVSFVYIYLHADLQAGQEARRLFVTCDVGRDLGGTAQFFTPDLVLE
jgi:hypothetical protein